MLDYAELYELRMAKQPGPMSDDHDELEVTWLFTSEANNNDTDTVLFRELCSKGHLGAAMWVYENKDVDIHDKDDLSFHSACIGGFLELSMWLHSLGDVNIQERTFIDVCYRGHFETALWLHSLGEVDIHALDDRAFVNACSSHNHVLAAWLFDLGEIDLHAHDDEAFYTAVASNDEIAVFIYDNFSEEDNDFVLAEAFLIACSYGHTAKIQNGNSLIPSELSSINPTTRSDCGE